MNAHPHPRPDLTSPPSLWSDRNQQWLVASIGRLRERLEHQANRQVATDTAAESVFGDAPDVMPALVHCAHAFGLSLFEQELLLLVVGLELDHGLRAAVATLNGGNARASFGLALGMLDQPHWDALSPDAALRHWRLVEIEPGVLLTQASLRIDERILHFISGVAATDPRIHDVARYVRPSAAHPESVDSPLVQRIAEAIGGGGIDRAPVLVLHGEPSDPVAQRDLALAAVARCEQPALWIATQDLPGDPGELDTIARRVDREAALTGAVPILVVEPASESLAVSFAGRLQGTLLWLGQAGAGLAALPNARRVIRFAVPVPDAERARDSLLARWRRSALEEDRDDASVCMALRHAAAHFRINAVSAEDVVEQLIAAAPSDRTAAAWSFTREAARGGLDVLAQRIVTRVDFNELVLPPAQIAALRDIARQLKHRERVYREWGFGEKHARGQGLTALFAGESGTGKTLAAEAIANEVDLDLYRVDLATLVSKYIGETEKNLKRLFDAAEASGAVLLFDEADALFGKRSEVKDSHDRYANIEVAYLLQRIEAYRGLAILTTNMKSALDRAFLRRIRFVVNFPFPDAAAREQIWRRQFPPRAPVGDVDFAALARLNLSGGHIHSVVLNAAFKAADGEKPIDQDVLMAAARSEFAKLERAMGDTQARGTG